jgi:HD-like signal output (HDOD) protein
LGESLASPQNIAPMPRVCAQLAELTAQQATDAAQLARLIQSDAALAGELMRVANSPALRPRSPVVSLQQAVSWLGVAEVRNIAMAVMLRGEVFTAPGHEPESEELWREAWLAGLWAKEIAKERRKHVESAFLAALMHRTGAALALKILSGFEVRQRTVMDAQSFADLVTEFEPRFGRLLMSNWHLPDDVQDAASDWRDYRSSSHVDLAGTVHAAHLLATHTLHPQLLDEGLVLESPVFEQLGVFPDDRRALLAKRDQVRSLAGM